MKYLRYIFLFLLLPLAISCRKDSSLEVPLHTILFSPILSDDTKALKPGNPAIQNGNKANLFGIRKVGSEVPSPVFDSNELLEYDQSSGWTYSPLKSWKNTGHYYFAGVFPSPSNSQDISFIDNESIRVVYKPANNYDMMLARADRDRSNGGGTTPVNLLFKHTCSAVRFLFGAISDDYVISSFKLIGLAQSAELTVPIITAGPNDIRDGWSARGYGDDLFEYPTHSQGEIYPMPISEVDPEAALNPDNFTPFGWYFMIPQTLLTTSEVSFSVQKILSYEQGQPVYSNPITTVLSITDRDGVPGADTWIPNDVYNYFITISQAGLELTVKTTLWDDVTATTDDFVFEPD